MSNVVPYGSKRRRSVDADDFYSRRRRRVVSAVADIATGNYVGAAVTAGAQVMDSKPIQKKSYMTINALSGRSAIKKKGRISQKKSREVKVSKNLSEKVKKVIEGQTARGLYVSEGAGFIGAQYTTANSSSDLFQTAYTAGDYSNNFKYFKSPGYTTNPKSCLWFTGLINNIDGSNVPQNSGDLTGHPLLWFVPKEILHAASMLFNGKSQVISAFSDYNWNTATGNFFTEGAELTAVADSISTKGLKIMVKNSFVEMKFQNTSNRKVKLTLYHCTPKRKFIAENALQCMWDAIRGESGISSGVRREGTLKTTESSVTSAVNSVLYDHNFEPKVSPGFSNGWTYERVELFIAPGETLVTNVQGPKNAMIDYNKFYDSATGGGEGSANKMGLVAPGCGVQTMIKLEYDDQLFDFANGELLTPKNWVVTNQSNLGDATGPVNNYVYAPVIVSYKKFYEIKSPEVTGGYKLSSTSQKVILNSKKPAYHFNQVSEGITRNAFGSGTGICKLTYAFDEENPAAALTGGIAKFL